MRPSRLLRAIAVVATAVAAIATTLSAPPATAADLEPGVRVDPALIPDLDARGVDVHCVAQVIGIEAGVFRTQESCFTSAIAADAFVATLVDTAAGALPGNRTTSGSNTIGWHFTGTSFSGSNVRIVGSTCNGGVWPASGFWNNNIESSFHYCGSKATRFWDYSWCGGSSVAIGGSIGSFGWFNNRTSCVQYGY